ncbi:uncharacterized protein LOC123866398 isoform X2 [Maniola jurtina]|uniref:uncharacterized protein LOC123866398 isoform X2 n=1 Tax=Maniola jurtina TaxID=191418 RepID=UPI001E68D719|nr:uncharacterized protein LOC123866398 isoform X2 [Maniola jurtina]
MYYSSIFLYCFIVVVNLSLSGANPAWNAILPLESNTLSHNGNTIVNIGNGVNRNNVVILDQAGTLGNRFGVDTTPTANQPQAGPSRADGSRKVTSISNVENGLQNSNTVITVNDGQRTVISQNSNSDSLNNDGTSFVLTGNNGLDFFNVGYGSGNQNKVIINNNYY